MTSTVSLVSVLWQHLLLFPWFQYCDVSTTILLVSVLWWHLLTFPWFQYCDDIYHFLGFSIVAASTTAHWLTSFRVWSCLSSMVTSMPRSLALLLLTATSTRNLTPLSSYLSEWHCPCKILMVKINLKTQWSHDSFLTEINGFNLINNASENVIYIFQLNFDSVQ